MTKSRSITAVALIVCGSFAAALLSMNAATAKGDADKPKPDARHRVVFEVTHDGLVQWTAAINNVENIRKVFGPENIQIEVVGHNEGLGMLLLKDTELAEQMKRLTEGGVVFAACQNTMRKKNVTKADLLPFVTTVDSGVAEVVRKQETGFSYLKSGI